MSDVNTFARTTIMDIFSNGSITTGGVVGSICAGLIDVLWPSKEDVWSEIKANVEALIQSDLNQKLNNYNYDIVDKSLSGLKLDMANYLSSATSIDSKRTGDLFNDVQNQMLHDLPCFQSFGISSNGLWTPGTLEEQQIALLLLPLFTQFANLHLSLMRDGVLCGSKWGWSEYDVNSLKDVLKSYIKSHTDYCNNTYNNALQNLINNTPTNNHLTEPFLTINRFVREMTLSVLDFKNMWMYYDPTVYPEPIKINLSREIYSDPMGSSTDSGPARVNLSVNNEISRIEVWGSAKPDYLFPGDGHATENFPENSLIDLVDACAVEYVALNSVDNPGNTGRMGDISGGSNQDLSKQPNIPFPEWENKGFVLDSVSLVDNPVVEATAYCGTELFRPDRWDNGDKHYDIISLGGTVNAIILKQKDGTVLTSGGSRISHKHVPLEEGPSPDSFATIAADYESFSYPDEILSSIKIMGISKLYGTADCVIFGFKFPNSPDSIDNARQVFTNVSNLLFNKNGELISPYHDGGWPR